MIYNFNAGPSILPQEVLQEASRAVINFNNSGLSILEIGHRTSLFEDVLEEARSLVKELMKLDEEHEVLFLHGGATTQFMQIPMNLLDENETVAIADTGVWSTKAIKEAKFFGNVALACSSKDRNYSYIPSVLSIPEGAKYLHLTTNNTIFGTQWQSIPKVNVPIVADMSSDILSRQIDFNRFGIIYAGAQKNMGAAGTTLVVIKKDLLGKINRKIPSFMDYRNHIEAESMLNTPPVYSIYLSMLTLRWLKKYGGVAAMEEMNTEKAKLIYQTIDNSKLYKGNVDKADRSTMNACFTISDKEMESRFLQFTIKNHIYGIKGHRLSGGFRVSMYNALPISSVKYLIEKMNEFEQSES